jgi:hypothetical protein
MPKQLRINKMDSSESLTVKELSAWLTKFPVDAPVVLKCGKNFRLSKMLASVKKVGTVIPILIGKRSVLK